MKGTQNKPQSETLRQKAEELLKKKQQTTVPSLSEADTLKLIHELEVNQIELEAINNELIQAKERADFAKQKYAALFDSASFGYFMLSREGKIIESNLIGASMFGKESLLLKNSKFDFFVSNETKPTFNLFLQEIFNSKNKGSCELTLWGSGKVPIHIYLTGIVTEKG